MYNVQKDVHELRKKLEMSEASDQKNEKMHAIEDERNWYGILACLAQNFDTTKVSQGSVASRFIREHDEEGSQASQREIAGNRGGQNLARKAAEDF